jgi:hypothetical protein
MKKIIFTNSSMSFGEESQQEQLILEEKLSPRWNRKNKDIIGLINSFFERKKNNYYSHQSKD